MAITSLAAGLARSRMLKYLTIINPPLNSCLRPCSRIGISLSNELPVRSFTSDKPSDNNNNNNKGTNSSPEKNKAADDISSPADAEEAEELLTSVYVHPLSQIVLRHFQTSCHHWIQKKKLDQNLVLHRDGTFVLTPPLEKDDKSSSLRIWTYYDGEDRKHWLSVTVNQVQHRFLLQDNMLSAWRGNKRNSIVERVQESVQDLMDAVEELE